MAFTDCWGTHAEKAGLTKADQDAILARAKEIEALDQKPMADALRQAAREHVEPKMAEIDTQLHDLFERSKVPVGLAQAPKGKAPKAPKVEGGFPDAFDESPLVQYILENGGITSKSSAERLMPKEVWQREKGEWDGAPEFKGAPSHNKIYSSQSVTKTTKNKAGETVTKVGTIGRLGMAPDEMAQAAFDEHLLPSHVKEPVTSSDLWQALEQEHESAMRTNKAMRDRAANESAAIGTAMQQEHAFKTDIATKQKGETEVKAAELNVDDTVEVNGVELKVTDVDEGGRVTLEDGKEYGVQYIEDGTVFYGKVKPEGWTSATAVEGETRLTLKNKGQAGAVPNPFGKVPEIPGLRIKGKANDLNLATASRSAKLQFSYAEAERAQRAIDHVAKTKHERNAMSIYREAGGDPNVLADWAARGKQKWFKRAVADAQKLTPEQKAMVDTIADTFDVLEKRGNKYGVLEGHRDNYIPQVWQVEKRFTGVGGSRLRDAFKFNKARQFENFFEGDQAGFKPKTLDVGELLPGYLHEMNTVIADRQFVQDVSKGVADDGRPLVMPRGNAKTVDATEYAVMKPGQSRAVSVHDTMAEAQAAMGEGHTIEARPATAAMVDPRGFAPAEKDALGNTIKIETGDYRSLGDEQPALSSWRWVETDPAGNATYLKSDLAAHPTLAKRLNAMTGQSAVRRWYREDSKGFATVPRAFASGLDVASSTMKREMFGLLSPFHQVQEATHAVFHMVNPFGFKKGGFVNRMGDRIGKSTTVQTPSGTAKTTVGAGKIIADHMANLEDMSRPTAPMIRGMKRGLMLKPEQRGTLGYGEGLGSKNSFISQISRKYGSKPGRVMADMIDGYQTYLFDQYIPALKWKTYQHIVERNRGRYKNDLINGEVSIADVEMLSAEQTNAAFGHLNKAMLDRNPTIQHFLQLGLVAPDFLEARGRFVGQAMKPSKAGHEQFRAIAVGAALQASIGIVLAKVLGGEWDYKHPFELTIGNRTYMLRSVPEDLFRATGFLRGDIDTTRQFVRGRINPITDKGWQLISGLNYRGEKVGALETLGELLAGFIPLSARAAPGLRDLTETSRQAPISPLEQFAGSSGLKVGRHSPITQVYSMARDWEAKNGIKPDKGSYPVSQYQQLRYALEDDDSKKASEEIKKLIAGGLKKEKIASGFHESLFNAFAGSGANDLKFSEDLRKNDPAGKALYDMAVKRRHEIYNRFLRLKK